MEIEHVKEKIMEGPRSGFPRQYGPTRLDHQPGIPLFPQETARDFVTIFLLVAILTTVPGVNMQHVAVASVDLDVLHRPVSPCRLDHDAVNEVPILIFQGGTEHLAEDARLRRGDRLPCVDLGEFDVPCRLAALTALLFA